MKNLHPLYHGEDYQREMLQYALFRKALEEVVDFHQFESFGDIGCQNGRLMESIKRKYPHVRVKGWDIFDWAKTYADESIREHIELVDLRNPLPENYPTYQVVNCTEVGEHIDAESEQIFLDNIARISSDLLILSWSNEVNPQHFNPKPRTYIIKEMEKRGFIFLPTETQRLRLALRRIVSPFGYQWWAEDVVVYVRAKQPTAPWYIIWGARNSEKGAVRRYRFGSWLTPESFQDAFRRLTKLILARSAQQLATTITRVSDGEFYFLRKKAVGSATPGKRGSLLPYSQIKMTGYQFGLFQNDAISYSPELPYRRHMLFYLLTRPFIFNRRFLGRLRRRDWRVLESLGQYLRSIWENITGPRIPHEAIYSIVATKWIFRMFPNQIGLIGNEHKMKLIQELLKHREYRDYIGVDSFTDYISIPQKGAADYPDKLAAEIGAKLEKSKAKIFLVGMAHAKTAALWQLKNYSDAIFIDVGTGIDAIAGCVNQERPQFADWVNYRIKEYDYSGIDQLDYTMNFWDKSKYKTVLLEAKPH